MEYQADKTHWLFNRKNYLTAIAFLMTSVPAGIWQTYTYFDEKKREDIDRKISFTQSLRAIEDVYAELSNILFSTTARKVLLLRIEDSGQIPMPGKELYSSIIYEVHDRHTRSSRDMWQRRPVDAPYISMLVKVASIGMVENRRSEMPKGILRDIYEANHIERTFVYSIHQEPSLFFYVSIIFSEDRELDVKERVAVKASIDKMRVLFKDRRNLSKLLKER